MARFGLVALIAMVGVGSLNGQQESPILFDVHVHANSQQGLERQLSRMDSLGIGRAVVLMSDWSLVGSPAFDARRLIPAISFPCPGGVMPNGSSSACSGPDGGDFPGVDRLSQAIDEGQVRALGEVITQYYGIEPDHNSMRPYWALAEDKGVPVGIHLALAPPLTANRCCPGFRTRLGDPRLLEDILVRHPTLRVYVMHAGHPYLEELLAIMLVYPQVYADLSAISSFALPRAAFHAYLRELVEAGLADRLMFGSDGQMSTSIEAIESATFLDAEQKAAILAGNALRFFGPPPAPGNR